MAYDLQLAERIRKHLSNLQDFKVEEKKMFKGLAFIVNGKMCVNASGDNLMCRFDPGLQEQLSKKKGYQPMMMKGKQYKGYCYVEPEGFKNKKDFEFWVNVCLDFNGKAKSSRK